MKGVGGEARKLSGEWIILGSVKSGILDIRSNLLKMMEKIRKLRDGDRDEDWG